MQKKLLRSAGSLFIVAAAACTYHLGSDADRAAPHILRAAPSRPVVAATPAPHAEAEYLIKWSRGHTLIDAGISETDPPLEHTTLPSKTFFDICTQKHKSFTEGKRFFGYSVSADPASTDELDKYEITSRPFPRGTLTCKELPAPGL